MSKPSRTSKEGMKPNYLKKDFKGKDLSIKTKTLPLMTQEEWGEMCKKRKNI